MEQLYDESDLETTEEIARMCNVQMAFQMLTRIVVRTPLMLIFSLIMSFSINAKLALIFLALMPVIGITLYVIMSKAHPIFERVFKKYDVLNNVVEENTNGIRVVKSYYLRKVKRKNLGTFQMKYM